MQQQIVMVGNIKFENNTVTVTCNGPYGEHSCLTEVGGTDSTSEIIIKRMCSQMAAVASGLVYLVSHDKSVFDVGMSLAWSRGNKAFDIELFRNSHVFVATPKKNKSIKVTE